MLCLHYLCRLFIPMHLTTITSFLPQIVEWFMEGRDGEDKQQRGGEKMEGTNCAHNWIIPSWHYLGSRIVLPHACPHCVNMAHLLTGVPKKEKGRNKKSGKFLSQPWRNFTLLTTPPSLFPSEMYAPLSLCPFPFHPIPLPVSNLK